MLLGGFPASSHQFRNLIPALADRFHVLSPDYPGFGNTDMPDPATWDYTFDHLAEIVDGLLARSASPARWGSTCRTTAARSATGSSTEHPDWLQWQVIQNANSYEEGFTAAWDGIRHVLWANRSAETEAPLEAFLQPDTVKASTPRPPGPEQDQPGQLEHGPVLPRPPERPPRAARPVLRLPHERRAVSRPGRSGCATDQPKTLIFWGQGDIFFTPEGGEAYLRDLPDAELVRLDSGHFAVEDCLDEIASGIKDFYDTNVK